MMPENESPDSPDEVTAEEENLESLKEAEPERKTKEVQETPTKNERNYMDQLLRLQAEFSNYRKRTEREKMDAIRFGREAILEKLISLNDIMQTALQHSHDAADIASLKKGFEMVVQEFLRLLKSEGVEPLKTENQIFDPHLHEALAQIPTEKREENNMIIEEIQKGYLLNGRLLRPSKVKVAKITEKEEETESGDPQKESKTA